MRTLTTTKFIAFNNSFGKLDCLDKNQTSCSTYKHGAVQSSHVVVVFARGAREVRVPVVGTDKRVVHLFDALEPGVLLPDCEDHLTLKNNVVKK